MSDQLLIKLEEKINDALDVIEGLRLQLEEANESNQMLKSENAALQKRQNQWEQSLSSLLKKLSHAELLSKNESQTKSRHIKNEHGEEMDTTMIFEEL